LNNSELENTGDDLEQADGWNNLYYNINKDDSESDGYRAFGVQTSKGFYYFKLDANAPDTLEESIINLLGIQKDDELLSTIF
jgi:hypothetical protein